MSLSMAKIRANVEQKKLDSRRQAGETIGHDPRAIQTPTAAYIPSRDSILAPIEFERAQNEFGPPIPASELGSGEPSVGFGRATWQTVMSLSSRGFGRRGFAVAGDFSLQKNTDANSASATTPHNTACAFPDSKCKVLPPNHKLSQVNNGSPDSLPVAIRNVTCPLT